VSDPVEIARDAAVVTLRDAGACAALVVTLQDGVVLLSANYTDGLPEDTIYRMVLTLGREFQRAIVEQLTMPQSAAIH